MVLAAIIWGLIQGLSEFLPVSSSGHLVIIPALLARIGVDIEPPSLAISAVLHLGTLIAVLAYYRQDIWRVIRFRTDPGGRKIALLVGDRDHPSCSRTNASRTLSINFKEQ